MIIIEVLIRGAKMFGKDLFNLYKMPNRKKKLLSKDFLNTLKLELDKKSKLGIDEVSTYWGHYLHIEGTKEYYSALSEACNEYNIKKAIFDYVMELPKEKADKFNDKLILLMVDKGIIKEGNIFDGIPDYEVCSSNDFFHIENVEKHKGYNVICSEWKLKEKEIIR